MKKLLTILFAVALGLNLSAQDDCGSGTIWDAETSKCVPDPENCGAGTYWNYLESQCLPFDNCPEDLDNDGLVAVSDLLLLLSAYSDVCLMVGGCTDYDATNFDPNADFDDGSCVLTVLGCMSEFACNYLAEATEDDGTCDFFTTDLFEENEALLIGSSSFLNGCPDGIDVWDDNEVVLDYSGGPPILVFSGDDAAYLLEEFGESSGAVILQVLQNSTLSFCENLMYISNETFTFPAIPWNGSSFEIELLFDMYLAPAGTALGCGDSQACNFTPCLFSENELCEYAVTGFDCNGNCFVDTDGDGICDE
ncbi:hypothetical protein N9L13_08115, partial [Flavobacteriales bacterium]|nr:hypothetical protein [Flavobacteriales bacterium]